MHHLGTRASNQTTLLGSGQHPFCHTWGISHINWEMTIPLFCGVFIMINNPQKLGLKYFPCVSVGDKHQHPFWGAVTSNIPSSYQKFIYSIMRERCFNHQEKFLWSNSLCYYQNLGNISLNLELRQIRKITPLLGCEECIWREDVTRACVWFTSN